MNPQMTKEIIRANLEAKLARYFGVKPDDATEHQIYQATVMTVKDILTEKRSISVNQTVKIDSMTPILYFT